MKFVYQDYKDFKSYVLGIVSYMMNKIPLALSFYFIGTGRIDYLTWLLLGLGVLEYNFTDIKMKKERVLLKL